MPLSTEKNLTAHDYEALPEGAPYQLIGGKLIRSECRTVFHQDIIANLIIALSSYADEYDLGEMILSPMDVYLTNEDVYQPDLIFIRKENVSKLDPNDRIRFVPDVVIEVLSPGTGTYDYTRKKRIYCERGVQEYWIVDPDDRTVETMQKQGAFYQTIALAKAPGTIGSPMFPGFSMKVEDVFAM